MEKLSNKQMTILIILLSIPIIIIIMFFIAINKVYALDISDFQNITGGDIGQNQTKNTYLTTSQLTSNSLQTISHDYTGLNIDVSNKKYIIIQLNRSWNLSNEQYCWQSSQNVGSNAATSGGCSFESNTNWSEKVYITTDNTGLCAYDGTYAICPVGNANRITAVHYQMFYDLTPLTATSIQGYDLKFTLNTRLARYIYFSNGSGESTDITNKIQEQIQEQEQQTQEVIDNANQNTQDTIESQQVCTRIDKSNATNRGYLNSNGGFNENTGSTYVTEYIKISNTTKIKILHTYSSQYRFCFYDDSKNLIECKFINEYTDNSNVVIPDNAKYIRFTINSTYNRPQFEICKNGNQANADLIEEAINLGENVQPDDPPQDVQDVNQSEEELLESISTNDYSNNIDLDLDQNSNEFVWNKITNILQANSKIFSMIISILVLGVLKTILGR